MTDADPSVRVVDRRWWAQGDGEHESPAPAEASKPAYVAELERRLAEKDDQIREYARKLKSASQEFDEARVRLRREIAKDVERERRAVLTTFLDVVDNLDRALEAARNHEPGAPPTGLKDGVDLVRRQFLDTLKRHGVEPIDAAGAAFDPTLHDAISMVPVEDEDRSGRVIDVVKPGYRIDQDVLRPATVTVGQVPAASGGRS